MDFKFFEDILIHSFIDFLFNSNFQTLIPSP